MTRLERLIAELCPCGVEYLELGRVVNILDKLRKPITKKDRVSGSYPYYGANGIQDYIDDYIFDGTYILMGEDGSVIRSDNTPVLSWAVGKISVNNHAHVISEIPEKALLRYVYYCLSNTNVSSIVRGTPPKINQQNLRSILLPIPPLELQAEIVQILDRLTELTQELTTQLTIELTKRKQQYEYYRDSLFTFGDDVEYLELGSIVNILDKLRKPITKKDRVSGSYPYYGANGIQDYIDDYIFDGTYILMGEDGSVIRSDNTPVLSWAVGKIWVNNHAHVMSEIPEKALLRYVYYCLSNTNVRSIVRGAPPKINQQNLRSILLPIPPIKEQERIVKVLDHFNSLYRSLSNTIPAEIKARKQQYEYYRDKLLTFNEIDSF